MNSDQTAAEGALVVGLDCSTTATKAIAFDRTGNVIARAHEAILLSSPQPDQYEQNHGDWWSSAQRVLKRVAHEVGPERISALAVSNQRETFVPLNGDEQPLRPAIVWLDERCKGEVESFSRRVGWNTMHRITGKPPDFAPVVYRLAWMKRHEPGLFRQIRMICDVQSYIVRRLTGSWMTSWASADPLGLFDTQNKKWAPVILNALGLNEGQLPAVSCPGAVIGRISEEAADSTGLSVTTEIVAGGGDGQAAGLGANVLSSQRAYLNLGTAVVAGIYGTRYRTSKAFRTMCSCSDSGYYYECSLRAGTFAVEWLIKKVLNIDPLQQSDIYEKLNREAQDVGPGSGGLFHLPYMCGVMNPFWDMNARGAFVGLSSSHRRGHVYRAILEGIAFEQLSAINSVEKTLGSHVREFIAIGGGAVSDLWCHVFADITGRNICIPAITEASALGAGIAAAVGTGWYRSFQEAARGMTRIDRTIKPNRANRSTYNRLFSVYRKIYPSVKNLEIDSVRSSRNSGSRTTGAG